MGWNIYRFGEKGGRPDAESFEEAAMMAKEAIDKMCELADEMADRYGERSSRHGYGERSGDWHGRDEYGERRSRDSRGRYM